MKHLKHFLIYLSIVTIVTISIFSKQPLKVYAEVPSSQKVVARGTTWGNYNFTYSLHRKYFTIEDPTGIPTNPLSGPYYFYTADNVTFFEISGTDLIQIILTRGLNIVLKPEKATAFIQAFFTYITQPDLQDQRYRQGGLYDSQGNFYGYCLNDISGCYYEGITIPENKPAIDIPSEQVNNVYNGYQYYNQDNYPDYITVNTPSNSWILSKYENGSGAWKEAQKACVTANLDTWTADNENLFAFNMASDGNTNSIWQQFYLSGITTEKYIKLNNYHYIQSSSYTYWNNFCEYYEVTDSDNQFLASEMYLKIGSPNQTYISFDAYDTSNNIVNSFDCIELVGNRQTSPWSYDPTTSTATYTSHFTLGRSGSGNGFNIYSIFAGSNYTIYKNADIYNSINNHTYQPNSYNGTNYYNYNTNTDNGITVTQTQLDNSTTTNTTIYTEINDDSSEYIDNSVVNNETITNNTTTIINNYYPTNNDPEDPENPEDPDNPGGGGNGNIDDDGVLATILNAILRLFRAIGEIIGTILAGIIEMVDIVLESISGILSGMEGMSDFFASLLAWLPEPIPQIIGIGFGLCILCAVISFIRG